jgi:hypothetical protein
VTAVPGPSAPGLASAVSGSTKPATSSFRPVVPGWTTAGAKFIGGVPMKPATNRLTGSA